jgi:hypothetical protein
MTYRLKNADRKQILFKRKGQWGLAVLGALFTLIGLLFAVPAGLLTVVALASGDEPFIGMGLSGIGLFLLSFAVFIRMTPKRPKQFMFDNDKSLLEVMEHQRGRGLSRTLVPFLDIQGFDVHRALSSSSNRSTYWELVIQKTDGASWGLMRFRDREKAKDVAADLNAKADFTRETSYSHERDSGLFTVENTRSKVQISWKTPGSPFGRICGMVLLLLSVGSGGVALAGSGQYIAGGVVLVFALLLLALTPVSINRLRRGQTITIENDSVHCLFGSSFGRSWTLPKSEIAVVAFNLRLGESAVSKIDLLTKEEAEMMTRANDAAYSMEKTLVVIQLAFNIHSIDIVGLSFGQAVELEKLLQKHMTALSHTY